MAPRRGQPTRQALQAALCSEQVTLTYHTEDQAGVVGRRTRAARTLATTCLNGVSGRTVTTGVIMTSLTVLLIPIAFHLTRNCNDRSRAATAGPFGLKPVITGQMTLLIGQDAGRCAGA